MASLSISRTVAGVCVGVDRPRLLHDLSAAASGAKRFHEWLLEQKDLGVCVESTLLTDANGAVVTRVQILEAVKAAVKQSCDVLFLYLAGHGVAHSAYEEKLLLSGVADDDAEAVNLHVVKQRGKYCGIPHVVVIYDACRSFALSEKLRQISAGPIFPAGANSRSGGHVDVFYACAPDESSFEVADNSGANPKNYKAFFTELLIDALRKPPSDLIELSRFDGTVLTVIPCAKLELMLERDVPRRAAEATPAFEQSPDIDVLSHMPSEFFAVVALEEASADAGNAVRTGNVVLGNRVRFELKLGAGSPPPPSAPRASATLKVPGRADLVRSRAAQAFGKAARAATADQTDAMLQSISRLSGFERVVADVRRAKGRPNFETSCGFTVIGARPLRVDVSNNPPVEFVPWDSTPTEHHYRVGTEQLPARGGTALIEFDHGAGVAMAILPGYVGTVLVDHAQVRAITYTLSANTREYAEYDARREEIDQRRAVATAAASIGQLQQLVKSFGPALPEYIRVDKALDPCLGVLAAHAYCLVDDQAQVESVWRWMSVVGLTSNDGRRRMNVPVPFDVAMLARKLDRRTVAASPGIAPCCPWLSLGWSQLELFDLVLHPAIVEAARHRLPGTWTSFSARGLAVLREALLVKEIR